MFSFPEGLRLKRASQLDAPQATYFNYVMVNEFAEKCYACCIIFYEPLDAAALEAVEGFRVKTKEEADVEAAASAAAAAAREAYYRQPAAAAAAAAEAAAEYGACRPATSDDAGGGAAEAAEAAEAAAAAAAA